MSCRTRRRRLKDLKLASDTESMSTDHSQNRKASKQKNPDDNTTTLNPSTTIADKDALAVEWWRKHHQEGTIDSRNKVSAENDLVVPLSKASLEGTFVEETVVGEPPFNIVAPFTTTLENSQRDSKGRPYNITRQGSIKNPENGMVLDPKLLPKMDHQRLGENPSLGIFETKSKYDRNRIEFFQPQVEPTLRVRRRKLQVPLETKNSVTLPSQTISAMATKFNCYGDEVHETQNSSLTRTTTNESQSSPLPDTRSIEDQNIKEVSLSEYNAWVTKGSPVRTNHVSDKNPHTSTRSPKNIWPKNTIEQLSSSCQPMQFGDDDKDDDDDDDDDDRVVRFNGWSFQKSTEYPFSILGTDGCERHPRVLTPGMMETLRGFMPMKLMNQNFWLRFSLARDGASFPKLLASIRASKYTVIGLETDYGEVFGSFTATPFRIGSKWYGSSKAFLWRLKEKRYTSHKNARKANFEGKMELYHCTGDDEFIQYCTAETIAVGGGEWQYTCPYKDSNEGIGLVIDGDLAGGETNSCATFANPKLARHATVSSEFAISNLEVWSLTEYTNVEDASEVELRESPRR